MTLTDVAAIRLISQQIAGSRFKTPKEMVGWMGAMQAQDYRMAKWAVGIRIPNATEKNIEAAIDSGKIIRTHLLRPTWHLVAADDIYWMLELSAPRIKAAQKSREKQLELTEKIFIKSNTIFEKALAGGKHLTRVEMLQELAKVKIATDNNRSSYLLFNAESEGIICSGKTKDKQITYALLNERVPENKKLNKDEALYRLANKYFKSHCPATLQDFTWWSGLSVSDAKHALEIIKPGFISDKIGSGIYWFPDSFSIPKNYKESAYLLPAFDEFLISYKDRTAALAFENHKKAFSNNGIFWPTLVVNGQVKGIWKRTFKKDKVIVTISFFGAPGKDIIGLVEKAAEKLGYFLGHEIEMIHQ
ncbi:MAG: winged helix DNA-binding domain-containing protein [Ginsengibacter sp.]